MIFLDSETCGLTGPMVLLQYAKDDEDIKLHEIWYRPIKETLEVIEDICSQEVCVFNLIFDWFHINKIYNVLRVFYDNGYHDLPTISSVAAVEATNPSTYCLKPKAALDLMLYARRGPYQYVMKRKPIRVRKIPNGVVDRIANELERVTDLPSICFAKARNQPRWSVVQQDDKFSDIVLNFRGSSSLGALATEVLGEPKADWPIPEHIQPTEVSWLPFGQYGNKGWAKVIGAHIAIWHSIEKARYYARRDIVLLRDLYKAFKSCDPDLAPGDDDSELAASLGATRWRGFALDKSKIGELRDQYKAERKLAATTPAAARDYIAEAMGPIERKLFKSTKKDILEQLTKTGSSPEVKQRAANVIKARSAKNRLALLEKLDSLPSFHPDFKIIGTKSNRMSGGSEGGVADSINPQGIPRDPRFRSIFSLAFPNETLEGGDGDQFEITILDAVVECPRLRNDLVSGKKFHGVMGKIWFNIDYEEIMATKKDEEGKYELSKRADFAFVYGAQPKKLAAVTRKSEQEIEEAYERLRENYKEILESRDKIALSFCSMRQPGGLGSRIEWHEPADYIESIFGFRRYFTIENKVTKLLFDLMENPPSWLNQEREKIVRNAERGEQTVGGATRSALAAAAFSLQQANMRAACNHVIQSPGGQLTKRFQRTFWDLQPVGINPWRIRTMNIHDELIAVHNGTVNCKQVKDAFVATYKPRIPLLSWSWDVMKSWGEKK